MTHGLPDHLLTLVLVVLFPLYATRTYRTFMAKVQAGVADARVTEYRVTMAIQWVLLAATLGVWALSGRSAAALGLTIPAGSGTLLGLGLTVLALALLLVQWRAIQRLQGAGLDGLRRQLAGARDLLPATDREHANFRALCFTAGICEELLYRGYLIAYLAVWLGPWPAMLAAAVVFGLAHSYQGRSGILKTGAVGLVMGGLFLFTGSLLWPMILHVAVDLQGGAIGRRVIHQTPDPVPVV